MLYLNPESKALLKYTSRRVRQRLGAILLFTGSPGKGKSWAGGRFLELWYDQHFNEKFPFNNICSTLEKAVMLVKDFKRPGEGVLVEELSVHVGVRDSLTTQNKLFNKFVDICREKQAIIVGNCPHISFIDKHILMLSNVWVDCLGVDFRKEIVISKPLWLQTSPYKNKIYYHKFINEEGYEIDIVKFRKPSEEFIKFYLDFKRSNNDNLYDEIENKMKKDRIKKSGEVIEQKIRKPLTQAQEKVMKVMANHHYIEASKILGIAITSMYDSKKRAIKKGYTLEEFKGKE